MSYRLSPDNCVYFIGAEGDPRIKIGASSHPLSRRESLATWSPLPLKLLATAPGGLATERYLHFVFLAQWSHGKWFHPSAFLWALIAQVRLHGALPDELLAARAPKNFRLPHQQRKGNCGPRSPEFRAELYDRLKAAWKKRRCKSTPTRRVA
jgi:hypothetical protein